MNCPAAKHKATTQGQGPLERQLHCWQQLLEKGDAEQSGDALKSTARTVLLEPKTEIKQTKNPVQDISEEILLSLHETSFRKNITSSKAGK